MILDHPAAINSIGLFLDIVGVVLLFFYGLPNYVNPAGLEIDALTEIACAGPTPEGMKRWEWHRFWSRAGLVLLIFGFALQIVSNYWECNPVRFRRVVESLVCVTGSGGILAPVAVPPFPS